MTLTVELTPAQEAQLKDEAALAGLEPAALLLARAGLNEDAEPVAQNTPEWDALLNSPSRVSVHTPELSIDATRRESFYGDDLR